MIRSAWRKFFGPDAQAIMNAAIARAADLRAQVEEATTRVRYYHAIMIEIDPKQDWWEYAQIRQRWYDATEDTLDLEAAAARACGDVEALIAEKNK